MRNSSYSGKPTLRRVVLSADIAQACLSHAYITEKEEIMGLLLGCVKPSSHEEGKQEAWIWGTKTLKRSDKRKDRVEISPEQLSEAIPYAESLGKNFGKETRIVGWYHSHPHITVLPSHVDVMDPSFIGLIFSVFNEGQQQHEQGSGDKLEIIAFQSVDCNKESPLESEIQQRHHQRGYSHEYRQIPMEILPPAQIFGLNKNSVCTTTSSNVNKCLYNPLLPEVSILSFAVNMRSHIKVVISSRQHMRETLRYLVALAAQEEHETYQKYTKNTCQSNESHTQSLLRSQTSKLKERATGRKRQRSGAGVNPGNGDHNDDDDDDGGAGKREASSSSGNNLEKEGSGEMTECKRRRMTKRELADEKWKAETRGKTTATKRQHQPLCANRCNKIDILLTLLYLLCRIDGWINTFFL
eukprot:jgi/Bigna1/142095/aug1.67_g16803